MDCKGDLALGAATGAAFLTQTLLSWNAAPPTGATASAPVSMLMPRPPIWALFGLDRFRDQHAAAHAVEQLCGQRGLAARVAERDGVAIGDPERGGILRMDHHATARLRAPCDDGVSLKLVLRKLRDGTGGEPERMRLIRLLDDGPVVRQRRHLLPTAPMTGHCRTADAPNRP